MSKNRRIAIITDDAGWHGAQLKAAFARRRADVVFVSLAHCGFSFGRASGKIRLPGFNGALPDGVFVRGISAGSLEQVVFRLNILHALLACNVPVYNDARTIERTVDKSMTTFLLGQARVPTPRNWVYESELEARSIVRRETSAGRKVVLKPMFGAQGKGLQLLETADALPEAADYAGVYYLQSFVPGDAVSARDYRVLVAGGRALAAMERVGRCWITNRAQGARCLPAEPEGELGRLAESAARAIGAQYAGVDIIRHRDGNLQVLEVNGIPAWKGLQQVCEFDIAQHLVDDFMRSIDSGLLEAVS